ncbi:unnamed protein product [Amoebophrya sp. A120]|nr:unnamed protein product [Amoebophrya sp. A120]|eukprot:GSA120T00002872001.1
MKDLERQAAGVAGIGILALCFLGGYAESTRESISLESLVKVDNAATAEILAGTIRSVVLCFFCTGVIDVIVTLALLVYFFAVGTKNLRFPFPLSEESDARGTVFFLTAALAVLFRLAYACVIISCLNSLVQVPKLVLVQATLTDEQRAARSLLIKQLWDAFYLGFNGVALGLFGIHLGLLAVPLALVKKNFFTQLILPMTLVAAGVGYTGDAIGVFLQDKTYGLTSSGLFVGEVLLMIWLLVAMGKKGQENDQGQQPFLQ